MASFWARNSGGRWILYKAGGDFRKQEVISLLVILGELQQLHYTEPTGGWQAKQGACVDILKHLIGLCRGVQHIPVLLLGQSTWKTKPKSTFQYTPVLLAAFVPGHVINNFFAVVFELFQELPQPSSYCKEKTSCAEAVLKEWHRISPSQLNLCLGEVGDFCGLE